MERFIKLKIVTSEDGKRCGEECEHLSDGQWCSLFADQVVDRRIHPHAVGAHLSERAHQCIASEESARG
jgi:hypothetical protein